MSTEALTGYELRRARLREHYEGMHRVPRFASRREHPCPTA